MAAHLGVPWPVPPDAPSVAATVRALHEALATPGVLSNIPEHRRVDNMAQERVQIPETLVLKLAFGP